MSFLMTFKKPMKTRLLFPICLILVGCGSDQSSVENTNDSNPSDGSATPALEVGSQDGGPRNQLTPMDVVGGAAPQAPNKQQPPKTPPNIPPGLPQPDFNKILGEGNWELKEVINGVAGPGEGPRGPDGKVIDPKTFLKQIQEAQAAQGGKPVEVQKAPIAAPPLPPMPSAKPLDASEAPKLPGIGSADKKSE